jgi:two-component system, chemotaxis family, chemotaxis protein CheY
VLKVLKEEDVRSKVVMISAVGQQSVVDEGLKLGANEYIVKPFTTEQLIEVINRVF